MQEQYNKAYELYQAGKYNEALAALQELLDFLKLAENILWLRPWLLQCYILRNLDCPVQEMEVLEGLVEKLAEIDNLSDGDRQLGAEIYSLLGEVCCRLGECSLAVEAFLQSANWEQDKAQKLIEYSNAIFTTNYCDNISHEGWHELYNGYKHLLRNIQPLNAKPKEHQKYGLAICLGIFDGILWHIFCVLCWNMPTGRDLPFIFISRIRSRTVCRRSFMAGQIVSAWFQAGLMKKLLDV